VLPRTTGRRACDPLAPSAMSFTISAPGTARAGAGAPSSAQPAATVRTTPARRRRREPRGVIGNVVAPPGARRAGAATVECVSRSRTGLLAAVGAWLLWGLFPLYWPLLEPARPVEILGHRIVWSLVFLVGLLAFTSGFAWVRRLRPRTTALLTLAAVLVSTNWAVYIYGVNSGHVVETSLGYFINPLVTVLLAIVFLGERLRRRQAGAVAVAVAGVLVLTIDYGRVPWIALTLAVTFGLYGFVKKRAGVDGAQSLAVETAVLVVPASAYLLWLGGAGDGTFTSEGPAHAALLMGAGVVTALPLMLFGAAAVRIPLSTLGLLQYMTPTIQFLIGVLIYREPMPLSRLAGFALVWVALAILVLDAVGAVRSARAAAPAAAPA
jgi:chloramphenicol-sensitive protein RarD